MTEVAERRVNRGMVMLDMDVHDAALERIRWLWREFDGNLHVSSSGGKDSTVVMELAATVARENGERLSVHFLDQEAEWQGTVDYMRYLHRERDDIDLQWYQIPFRLSNNTSYEEEWGAMWDATLAPEEWMRPKEPDTIHENLWGWDGFYPCLNGINELEGGAHLSGMRAEEAPTRRVGMTTGRAYKWVTWGRRGPNYHVFHPLFDWSYRDIWKAINDHGWRYNRVYDQMFQYGVPTTRMRISSLTHVEAMRSLNYVQELEPETWLALTRRFPGINAYGHIGQKVMDEYLEKRPYMFDSDNEYLEYLIVNLIPPENQQKFRDWKARLMKALPWMTEKRINRQVLLAVMRADSYDSTGMAKFLYSAEKAAKKWEERFGPMEPRSWTCVPNVGGMR